MLEIPDGISFEGIFAGLVLSLCVPGIHAKDWIADWGKKSRPGEGACQSSTNGDRVSTCNRSRRWRHRAAR